MDKRTERAFLGKARHNLKNPVNAILGYSEMLIEDCEDEGLDHLIPDINKLNQAGNEILISIEEIFNDKALSGPNKSIKKIAEEMEIALRTPLNTIIGYSELLLEEGDKIEIDNFISDINKITKSGKMLEKELSSIIEFDSENIQIAFNVRYLLDGLKVINSDEISLCCNAATTPAVFLPNDSDLGFTYLVMPVQVRLEN